LVAATSAGAGAVATTTVTSRDTLTAHEILRGSVSFRTPAGWHTAPGSGSYTARFTVDDPQCTIQISASIRGKATRRPAAAQARAAIGERPAAAGRRAGGVYRVGAPTPSATTWLYGIAVVRVAPRRFGHLRIFASLEDPDCSAAAQAITAGMTRVLRHAKSQLRVARTHS